MAKRMGLRFKADWRISLFSLAFLPILLGLGAWQLNRAEQKRQILQQHDARERQDAIQYRADLGPNTKVVVKGSLEAGRYWLLEGRTYQGKPGYEVLMALRLPEQVLLVNRGWVPAALDRTVLPTLEPVPAYAVDLEGTLMLPSDSPLTNEADNQLLQWPHRILEMDIALMGEQLEEPIADLFLRLSPEHPLALQSVWQPTNMPPERHTAYAIQWFGLAFALVLLWLAASSNIFQLVFKRNDRN
jgi:surfeit locus 1 family protein